MGSIDREKMRERGVPGGGAGRRDKVGHSGVYPMSGPHPPGDAPIVPLPGWGQGARGAQGYQDAGESELIIENATPVKCRDLMSKDPFCCLGSDSADRVAQWMSERNICLRQPIESPDRRRHRSRSRAQISGKRARLEGHGSNPNDASSDRVFARRRHTQGAESDGGAQNPPHSRGG